MFGGRRVGAEDRSNGGSAGASPSRLFNAIALQVRYILSFPVSSYLSDYFFSFDSAGVRMCCAFSQSSTRWVQVVCGPLPGFMPKPWPPSA